MVIGDHQLHASQVPVGQGPQELGPEGLGFGWPCGDTQTRQAQSRGGEFDALVARLLADLSCDLSVPRLAEMARMSERNFARRFTEIMKIGPARFVDRRKLVPFVAQSDIVLDAAMCVA